MSHEKEKAQTENDKMIHDLVMCANLVPCRNSYFRRQMELRKVSQEKEKAQTENDKLMYDLERVATQNNKSQAALEKSQEEVARLQVRF